MKGKIIMRIEKLAVYLAENSAEKSIPIFSYKVKKPDNIEILRFLVN